MIVGHHPIYSLGNYGGYFSIVDQLKPLPSIGSFRTAYHANVGGGKDISNEHLKHYIKDLESLLFFNSITFQFWNI